MVNIKKEIKQAIKEGKFKSKGKVFAQMLKKVETLAKVNKDTAFDEEVMDLKIMLEE